MLLAHGIGCDSRPESPSFRPLRTRKTHTSEDDLRRACEDMSGHCSRRIGCQGIAAPRAGRMAPARHRISRDLSGSRNLGRCNDQYVSKPKITLMAMTIHHSCIMLSLIFLRAALLLVPCTFFFRAFLQLRYDARVGERRRVAEHASFGDVAQEAAHDFAATRFRQLLRKR